MGPRQGIGENAVVKRNSWIPLVAGAVAFLLTLGIGGAVGTDWLARNIEMDRLVSAIEASEASMGTVQGRIAEVFDQLDVDDLEGTTADAQSEAATAELARIAVDGADSIGAAGREIAAVNILPWHTKIKAAQEAYLLHNYAWQAYMQSAAEDPVALTVDQPLVNQSFEDAQEPLESVVPVVALFDLEARVANIFIEGAPQSNGRNYLSVVRLQHIGCRKRSCPLLTTVDFAAEGRRCWRRHLCLDIREAPPRVRPMGPAPGARAQLPTMSHMTAAHTANRRARFPRLVVSLAGVD